MSIVRSEFPTRGLFQNRSPAVLNPIVSEISRQLGDKLSASDRAELNSQLRETSPEILFPSLLNLGRRWKSQGDTAKAALLFHLLDNEGVPDEIRASARS